MSERHSMLECFKWIIGSSLRSTIMISVKDRSFSFWHFQYALSKNKEQYSWGRITCLLDPSASPFLLSRRARAHSRVGIPALLSEHSPVSLPYRSRSSCLLRPLDIVKRRQLQTDISYGSWEPREHRRMNDPPGGCKELMRKQAESSAKWNSEIEINAEGK